MIAYRGRGGVGLSANAQRPLEIQEKSRPTIRVCGGKKEKLTVAVKTPFPCPLLLVKHPNRKDSCPTSLGLFRFSSPPTTHRRSIVPTRTGPGVSLRNLPAQETKEKLSLWRAGKKRAWSPKMGHDRKIHLSLVFLKFSQELCLQW